MPRPESDLAALTAGIEERLAAVRARMTLACARAGRNPQSVCLVAVSKTFPAAAVRAASAAGQRVFAENYVQEGIEKIASLSAPDQPGRLQWHFIGPLQSNKTRAVAEHFDWVHTLDRIKIAQRLSEQRPAHLPPLNVCIQVNVSGEASKSGVTPAEAERLARGIAALPRLKLRGLMSIPEPVAGLEPEASLGPEASLAPEARLDAPTLLAERLAAQRAPHRALRFLFDRLNAAGLALDTLSMGMSADLEAAILEGATLVRIGSAIFGERDYAT